MSTALHKIGVHSDSSDGWCGRGREDSLGNGVLSDKQKNCIRVRIAAEFGYFSWDIRRELLVLCAQNVDREDLFSSPADLDRSRYKKISPKCNYRGG